MTAGLAAGATWALGEEYGYGGWMVVLFVPVVFAIVAVSHTYRLEARWASGHRDEATRAVQDKSSSWASAAMLACAFYLLAVAGKLFGI